MKRKPISVETFAGCGGFLLGAKDAGFECAMALDIDPVPLSVLKKFRPTVPVYPISIFDMPAKLIMRELGLKVGELDHFHGSWPCQAFSTNNVRARQMPAEDVDRFLTAFVDRVLGLKPKIVTGENVVGATMGFALPLLSRAVRRLTERGYEVKVFTVNCSTFGVPQLRPRMFLIAKRSDIAGELTLPRLPDVSPDVTIGTNFPGVDAVIDENFGPRILGQSEILPTICTCPSLRFAANGELRKMTIAELLRAQTFPPSLEEAIAHCGVSYGRAHKMIGNAVPCLAAKHIMKHLKKYITV